MAQFENYSYFEGNVTVKSLPFLIKNNVISPDN